MLVICIPQRNWEQALVHEAQDRKPRPDDIAGTGQKMTS